MKQCRGTSTGWLKLRHFHQSIHAHLGSIFRDAFHLWVQTDDCKYLCPPENAKCHCLSSPHDIFQILRQTVARTHFQFHCDDTSSEVRDFRSNILHLVHISAFPWFLAYCKDEPNLSTDSIRIHGIGKTLNHVAIGTTPNLRSQYWYDCAQKQHNKFISTLLACPSHACDH